MSVTVLAPVTVKLAVKGMVRGAKRQGGSKLFNTEGAQPAPGTSRSDCPFFWDWNRPVQGLELTGWPEFAFGPAVRVNVTAAANRDNLPADPFTPLRPGSREDDAASLWPVEPPQAVLLLAAAQVLWAYLLACFACLSACLLACLLACRLLFRGLRRVLRLPGAHLTGALVF